MSGPAATPLVSVICSTYNSKASLHCALRSVLNQDLADFEVRVMGDACTDGTEQVVAGFNDPRLHWFNFAQNTGSQSEPNNEGLRRARGRYVAFIGHDDLWFPWHLSRLVRHIEQTGADLVHDLAACIGPNGIEGAAGPPPERSDYARIYFPPSSWLHRRELPDQIGFWRQPDELGWAMDYDFTRRAALAGRKLEFLPSLGILKFHSVVWKAYARKGEPPQESWLRSILETPAQLNETVLAGMASQYAKTFQLDEKQPLSLAWDQLKCAARCAARSGFRELVSWYGENRWPARSLLRYRMKRLRSKYRVRRGLPA